MPDHTDATSDWVGGLLATLFVGDLAPPPAGEISGPPADGDDARLTIEVLEAVDVGIAIVDTGGRVQWANGAFGRLFGLDPVALRARDLRTVLRAASRPTEVDSWLTTTFERPDKRPAVVDLRFRALGSGRTPLAMVVARDAAERVAAEQAKQTSVDLSEQLRHTQRLGALGRLAGGLAHDFNNLLQVVAGCADGLAEEPLHSNTRHRLLTDIQNAIGRASSLTRQLLAFGRRQALDPQILDLNATVAALGQMLNRVIREDIRLTCTLAADLLPVKADVGQIEQVVLNLALNARDAMPDGGQMEIATSNLRLDTSWAPPNLPIAIPAGRWVRLSVRDTGCGMDAETLAQAFNPFFTTKDTSQGTGLGLSMVYGIVKQSGGYTWIESRVGVGTTVHILLPGLAEAGAATAAEASRPGLGLTRGTVLLVEDDTEVRRLFAAFLRHGGYDVVEATNGRDAVVAFDARAADVDLIVTDVVMPGLSGPALTELLRRRRPDMKALFVSGYAEEFDLRFVGQARTAHLVKPVTRGNLLAEVTALIHGPAQH
jgi:two-component system cell cycle sensor histidine kinase/response regulator CckA